MLNVCLIVSIPSDSNGFYPVNFSFELPMVIDTETRERLEKRFCNFLTSELHSLFYSNGLVDNDLRWCFKDV